MRTRVWILIAACLLTAGCGGRTQLISVSTPVTSGVRSHTAQAGQKLGFPLLATKNTTRVAGGDPIADAAGVALAVYPSEFAGTHPPAVVLAPTDDWEASLAAAVLMAAPVRAPLLLSGPGALPAATSDALGQLAPAGVATLNNVQVIRVGDVPAPRGLKSASISGADPFALTAAIDRYATAAAGKPTSAVVVASAEAPAYAMPAAGWAAESGDPLLFVNSTGVPAPTVQALQAHQHPNIYVLAPASVISDSVFAELGKYGPVKRIGLPDPAANTVLFAQYRDPPCVKNQPCVHVPGSFGWALTSPGHGYTLVDASRTLDAAAAAALSASGSYGPELLVQSPSQLPPAVLSYFLNYATPGYNVEGPTAAVYNHGWVIGDQSAISDAVQAQMDSLLEAVPQK